MMPYKILDDYKSEKTACREPISMYRDKLPEQVIAIWKEYGLGSFMNGFIIVQQNTPASEAAG